MNGSEHEINIDYRARKQLTYLLDDPNAWMTGDNYDLEIYNDMTELFCIFDACIQSLLQLCKFSFSRFISTKEFGHCDTIIRQSKQRRLKHFHNKHNNQETNNAREQRSSSKFKSKIHMPKLHLHKSSNEKSSERLANTDEINKQHSDNYVYNNSKNSKDINTNVEYEDTGTPRESNMSNNNNITDNNNNSMKKKGKEASISIGSTSAITVGSRSSVTEDRKSHNSGIRNSKISKLQALSEWATKNQFSMINENEDNNNNEMIEMTDGVLQDQTNDA